MTNEQEAAFLKLGALGDDELFLAGWDAALATPRASVKISELPIADMTREEEFEKWWAHRGGFNVECPSPKEISERIWNVAWTTAKLGQLERAKAEALSEIKAKLFADATSAFLDGDDAEAISLRDIANSLGK